MSRVLPMLRGLICTGRANAQYSFSPCSATYGHVKYGPAAWEDIFKPQAKQEDAAEEHRLQYVAATRAKRLLVVSRYEEKDEDGFWADLYPFLDKDEAPELTVPAEATETTPEAAPTSWQPTSRRPRPGAERAIAAGSQPR